MIDYPLRGIVLVDNRKRWTGHQVLHPQLHGVAEVEHRGGDLRESEEHYRHSVELNPQIPWTADNQGNILSSSTRWMAACWEMSSSTRRVVERWMEPANGELRGSSRTIASVMASVSGRTIENVVPWPRTALASLVVLLLLMPHLGNPVLFFILAAIIYLAYGGGFGTMPATAGDYFGVKNAGAIYGLMLIAWSIAGVVGPILISWLFGSDEPNYTLGYTTMGVIGLAAVLLTFVTRVPRGREAA